MKNVNIYENKNTSSIIWTRAKCRCWLSWSYGSWIFNYLCYQSQSPLKLWVRIPLMAKCTRYSIMW